MGSECTSNSNFLVFASATITLLPALPSLPLAAVMNYADMHIHEWSLYPLKVTILLKLCCEEITTASL